MAKADSTRFIDRLRRALAVVRGKEITHSTEDAYQDTTSPTLQGAFRRLYKDYINLLQQSYNRRDKYSHYEYLDKNLAEASAALNIYADNIVSGAIGGEENYSVVIDENTPDKEKIEEVVTFNEKMSKIKDAIWEIARNMTCYGDDWRELVVAESKDGRHYITKLKALPPREIYADVDNRGVWRDPLFPYIQKADPSEKEGIRFDWWRVIHFKIGQGIYGVDRALFAGAPLRIGRQLLWVDECLVIARMSRAWLRYAFFIDTTGLSPEEKWTYVDQFMSRVNRFDVADESTGRIHNYEHPRLPDEDIGIPTSAESKQDVRVLSGDPNVGKIEDIKYLQNKFLMAVSVPKAYMSIEEGTRAKATLQQIDVQFARQVRRRQAALVPGLRQFYEIAFTLAGIDHTKFKWDVVFPEMATMDEMLAWETQKLKVEIAKILAVDIGAVNNDYIYYKVLGFTEDEVKRYGFPKEKEETLMTLPPDTVEAVRRDPQVRKILDDLRDLIAWRKEREDALAGMKPIGVGVKDK